MSTWLIERIVYLLIVLIASVTGFAKWNRLTSAFRKLSVLLLVTFLFETAAVIFAYVLRNNALVYKVFAPVQVLFFTYIFAHLFTNKKLQKIIKPAGIVIVLIIIATSVFFFPARMMNTLSVVIKSVFFITLSLLKFREMLEDPEYENIIAEPVFWFCTAVLLFFTVNILYWAAYNYLAQIESKSSGSLYHILYYSNLVFYTMLWYSFVTIKNNQRQHNIVYG